MAKQTNRGGGATAKQSGRKKSESKSMQDKIINAALEEIYASVEAEQKKTPAAKAPAALIEKEKEKLEKYIELKKGLEESLKNLD